ncbi:IS3 family transposase [Streptomyces sp. NPDC048142]|uniref:IS3 family transposase n=1 Tax=Streptomyces sp. NPDC048142 TaxID=3365501 RepID=UPI0037145A1B
MSSSSGRTRSCGRLGLFRGPARPDPAQPTALVDEHPHLGVEPVLRELNIPSSTYCRWRQAGTEPCERRRRDAELTSRIQQIQQIHAGSGATYGSPRLRTVLKRGGVHVGPKRVERLIPARPGWPGSAPAGTRASPDGARTPGRLLTWFNATSPRTGRTGCGSPTVLLTLGDPVGGGHAVRAVGRCSVVGTS